MSQPIMYVDTSEVRPGRLEELKAAMNDLARFVQANEPHLLAYNVYFTGDGTRMRIERRAGGDYRAAVRLGLSDDEWEQPSLCAGWPHSGRAADSRGLRLHATDTDWSAGAGGRTAGTDPNASAAIDRAHHDRAATPVRAGVQTIIERSGIPRAEADQS